MAVAKRKRNSTKNTDKFEWTIDEAADLLAWVDYCVENGSGREVLKETVASRLKRNWGRDYTWERIDNRLKLLWSRGHNEESKSRKDMLEKGSQCLDLEGLERWFGADEITLAAIQRAKERVNSETRNGRNTRRKTTQRAARRGISRTVSATNSRYLEEHTLDFHMEEARASRLETLTLRDTPMKESES